MARKRPETDTAVTYVRVSTEEQVASGLGLGAQREKVTAELLRRGWRSVGDYADEGISAKSIVGRPGLQAALEALDSGEAANLVVAKLDRLSRSVHDFTGLMERARLRGWNLVVMDLGVDTSTPSGEMMANVFVSFAQFERKLIGQRTSDALQEKRRKGEQLGRPDRADGDAIRTVAVMRAQSYSLPEIAAHLNKAGVPTSQGGREWYPATVRTLLNRRVPACWSWPLGDVSDWDDLEMWHGGACAMCGRDDVALQRDHDHSTGLRRGLLCSSCNNHEGKCHDPKCRCASYRARPPAMMHGVEHRHGGWLEVTDVPEAPDETVARTLSIKHRRSVL